MSFYQSIESEFDRISPGCDNLKRLTEELKVENGRFMEIMDAINQSWKEPAATKMTGKGVKLNEYAQKEINTVQGIIEDIEKVAGNLFRIEKLNEALGNIRVYL